MPKRSYLVKVCIMLDKFSSWKHVSCILVKVRLNLRPPSKPSWRVTGNWGRQRSQRKRESRLKAPVNTATQRTMSELRVENTSTKRLTNVSPTASMMYQYFVKIVPTIYVKTDGEVRLSHFYPQRVRPWTSILSQICLIFFPGVKNKPVFSYQTRESG